MGVVMMMLWFVLVWGWGVGLVLVVLVGVDELVIGCFGVICVVVVVDVVSVRMLILMKFLCIVYFLFDRVV